MVSTREVEGWREKDIFRSGTDTVVAVEGEGERNQG